MYILEVLKGFSMENSKRGLVSFRHGIHLSKKMCSSTPEKIECMSKIPYALAIGSLMYAMLCTWPNIVHAVSVMSRYQSNLSKEFCGTNTLQYQTVGLSATLIPLVKDLVPNYYSRKKKKIK